MPEIEIRPATAADIPYLVALDQGYISEYVWQMDIQTEENQIGVKFREVRLPRSVRVDYPRSTQALIDDWQLRSGLLVATLEERPVGFISLMENNTPAAAWVTDLVVERRLRKQGIGTALILAAQEWARRRRLPRIVLEMQPKNHPAISLAQKLGFDFCGYNDRYFVNHDIALFFGKPLRS